MTTASAASQGYAISDGFQPTAAGDGTVGAGLNLGMNCVSSGMALCSDRLGIVRPSGSAAWDAGACEYQAVAGSLPPAITVQPTSQTVVAGQPATFTVVATGAPVLNYQWQLNGTSISGATSASYTISPATDLQNGAQVTVTVSNTSASVTSSVAILTVGAAPGYLASSTSTLNFGNVLIGSTSNMLVILSNPGSSSITISNVSVSGPGFGVSDPPVGLTLTPGQNVNFNVTFTPSASGPARGTVSIASNDPNSPAVIISVGFECRTADALGDADMGGKHFFRGRLQRVPGAASRWVLHIVERVAGQHELVRGLDCAVRPSLFLYCNFRRFDRPR